MRISMAVVCDSAVEYGGALCVLGTFDALAGPLPLVKNRCAIAVQVQWDKGEEGPHEIRARFMNEDGCPTLKEMASTVRVAMGGDRFYTTTQCVIHLHQLRFTKAGIYLITIFVDDRNAAEIPIQVLAAPAG